MKKQSGFTLIELMVVMAIIAILATAWLSAYTGYIKKARDATRITDLQAINTIILADMAADGLPPGWLSAADDLFLIVQTANNNQPIRDPLTDLSGFKEVCINPWNRSDTAYICAYWYWTCDSWTGYILTAHFESQSNVNLYDQNASGMSDFAWGGYDVVNNWYDIGSCDNLDDVPALTF